MTQDLGHGHVIPRPDGAKARCGGPALCSVCKAEQEALSNTMQPASIRPAFTMDTSNRFCVSVSGGKNPRVFKTMSFGYDGITPEEALVVAAWLVALAEPLSRHTFEEVLAKVRES